MHKCPHCEFTFDLPENGLVPYHDWPKPCRAICPGAKQPIVDSKALAKITQKIVEEQVGLGYYKDGWDQGDSDFVKWNTIECSQCQNQVFFDKIMYRHRCSKCGYGF